VVLPLHPRTRRRVEEFGLGARLDALLVVEPLDYATFLALCAESALLITDSGGLQVEATVYRRPLVVVRDTTEYPEIVGTFSSLVPPDGDIVSEVEGWLERLEDVHRSLAEVRGPYGDGQAAGRCLAAIDQALQSGR
ncbi:MAG: UDP-N-acetylglucosamine 2-epimerase, partial [Acidimicrobiia bacterium]